MKKALSLLLAVLMLVSLFGTMAFADDDVIVEEPVAEEPAPVDEVVGDGAEEAAAAVEEYTDEGSFEAADEITMSQFDAILKQNGWKIERMVPANPVCGQYVVIHCRDEKTGEAIANPTTVIWNHLWVKNYVYTAGDVDSELGWETQSITDATCTEQGVMHQTRKCYREGCKYTEKRDVTLDRLQHVWGTDPFGAEAIAFPNKQDIPTVKTANAIVVMPSATEKGVGHEACVNCGGLNPDTLDYEIGKHLPTDAHDDALYTPWFVKTTPTCLEPGYKERVCIVPGCNKSQDMDQTQDPKLAPYAHKDPETHETLMVFDHLERINCQYYAEVWVCSNPNCYSKWDAKANNGAGDWVPSDTPSQYVEYRGANDAVIASSLDQLKKVDPTKGKDYLVETKYNTELYLHHLYKEDWVEVLAPHCCEEGLKVRYCQQDQCPDPERGRMRYPIPALEPIYGNEIYLGYDSFNNHWYHFKSCTRAECQGRAETYLRPVFPAFVEGTPIVADPDDPTYYTQKNNSNKQALVVDHTWGEWNVEVPLTEPRGHLFRTCTVAGCGEREDFYGSQKEFDEKYGPVVLKAGIYKDEDGAFKLFEMGMFAEDFTGIYNGHNDVLGQDGKWYVVKGLWKNEAMGATLVGETWYFLAYGKVQEVTQLAEYQGKWFYVVKGVIDTSKTALVDYNGGKFVVAKGRIVNEYNGLWQNAKSIGGDDSWYYVANGQVQTQYTGLVLYDGEWFYVENGQLVPYNGEVEYDGEIFNVKEGMVVAA